MSGPFSTNELFLRNDRISFGQQPPEAAQIEQVFILPNTAGTQVLFGLSTMVSTATGTGPLQAIYPQNAAFVFDNWNKRLGIGTSTPQYSIDISSSTGIRLIGGTFIGDARGIFSVPTASLFSTLPTAVYSPGTIPPTAISSNGYFPSGVFGPSTIPLIALQSSGILYASSFVGDGYGISNIPLANINGGIVGNFFPSSSIPLFTLASTGQIWIKNTQGTIISPNMSTGQLLANLISANVISTNIINVQNFNVVNFSTEYLSSFSLRTSTATIINTLQAGSFYGDGYNITNVNPANLATVIPSNKFGYRLIAWDAINPYGNFIWEAGAVTFKVAAPVTVQGQLNVQQSTIINGQLNVQQSSILNTVKANYFEGNAAGIYNINAVSSLSLTSTIIGLGTLGYISSSGGSQESITSSLVGLGTLGYVSTASLVSTTAAILSLIPSDGFLHPILVNLILKRK
jgi:hypothetical protein